MSPADTVASSIIRGQAAIIGTIAWIQASKIPGLLVNQEFQVAHINGDTKTVLTRLEARFEHLFGQAAREVSREAVRYHLGKLPSSEVPSTLR